MWLKQKNHAFEDLEKQLAAVEKDREALEIKKIALDRTVESNRKILTDKIDNYKQVIEGEQETRDSWIERYERERKENITATARLVEIQANHKDELMGKKNAEIKLKNSNR